MNKHNIDENKLFAPESSEYVSLGSLLFAIISLIMPADSFGLLVRLALLKSTEYKPNFPLEKKLTLVGIIIQPTDIYLNFFWYIKH